MNPLLAQFIPEARDLLEQAGVGMLALERDASSQTVINDVFRAVHTLKGSSGLFEIGPLTRLVHAAEDLLCDVRTGDLALNSEIVDGLLDSLDVAGRWIDALETHETLPGDAEAMVTDRVARLRSWLEHRQAGVDPAIAQAARRRVETAPPAWLAELPETERLEAFAAMSGEHLLAWTFTPDEDCFFRGDDPIAMVRQSPGLVSLRVRPRAWPTSLDEMDPLQSILVFEALSDTPAEALEEHMRYVADAIEIRRISSRDLAVPTGTVADGPVFADFAVAARRGIAEADGAGLKRSVAALLAMTARGSIQASALRWCFAELERHGVARPAQLAALIEAVEHGRLGAAGPDAPAAPSARPDGPDIRAIALAIARQQIVVLQTPCDPAIEPGRIDAVAVVLLNLAGALAETAAAEPLAAALAAVRQTGDLALLTRLVDGWEDGATRAPARVAAAVDDPDPAPEASAPVQAGADRVVNRLLRIDQAKIDTIMNLVAELIVAKNGLSYLATRTEEVHGCRAAAREIKDQFAVIDRITQGLQVGVMSVRMMPVGQVFQRFPRLVRDIARKLGKKIDLVIEGEDTEADKNVLESLADPLIHMVRNSLDHGVESPADRLAAGKPEQGTVRISARQESDFVVIDVRDDGRGIDPQRVKEKAVQSGLVTREAAQAMSDEAAANLVFAPGFSTRDAVSDLSGRGVGMDVVRSAVIKAGGDVMLRSVLGAGTTVTVRLPLTMAVTRIVTIMCQGRVFGIPMDLVVETVRIARDRIHRIKGAETFVLRDTIVPMVRLARCLGLEEVQDREPDAEEAIMVVRLGRDRVGMVVDGFRERMEVIVKPLEGILEGLPGFSGTALLGDGRVLLILDLQEVL